MYFCIIGCESPLSLDVYLEMAFFGQAVVAAAQCIQIMRNDGSNFGDCD